MEARPPETSRSALETPVETRVAVAATPSHPERTRIVPQQSDESDAVESTSAMPASPPQRTRLGGQEFEESEERSEENAPEADEAPPAPESPRKAAAHLDIPNPLGNYAVLKELGRGGMGAVYLGRQLSLDRPVALKVMNSRWARDPIFVARFTREAYAAAQLVHHNVVQIYDLGAQDEVNFFSMEFVDGKSLGELIKQKGKLDPEEAVGYILQAARGLKFAHDRGLIHRDVKPDNLMINRQGIVKVADLGLVKTPGMSAAADRAPRVAGVNPDLASLDVEITDAQIAMGSPAYMSPEQCRDAARVDPRADIYSLGCTLYVMLTGRPPFTGNSAVEVMSKHAQEPVIPPETIVQRVPREVSAILLRMMAKDPADRYQDMDGVIRALEEWLGVRGNAPFSPSEEHLEALETLVAEFQSAPAALLRGRVLPAYLVGVLALAAVSALVNTHLLVGTVSLLIHSLLTGFTLQGLAHRSPLLGRLRQVLFGTRLSDLVFPALGGLMFLGVLFLTDYIWAWLGFGALGVGLGFAWQALVDRKLTRQRAGTLERAEALFRRLRLSGLEEEQLRRFVAKYTGNSWEEFFEALFGFEEKLAARSLNVPGQSGKTRPTYAAWREPMIRRLDAILAARQAARERAVLERIERKKLEAEGLSAREAAEQAEALAEQMVDAAAQIKQDEQARTQANRLEATAAPGQIQPPRRINLNAMIASVERPAARKARLPINPFAWVIDFILGWKLRFLLMVALLAGGVLWVQQNQILAGIEATSGTLSAQGSGIVKLLFSQDLPRPLSGPKLLPEFVRGFFDYVNPIAAGLLLLVTLPWGGGRTSLLLLAATAVMVLGHKLGLPAVGPLRPYVAAMALGAAVALAALLVGRRRRT